MVPLATATRVLASLAERQENWEKAENILAQAQRRWGDTVSQRLAVAELLSRRHGAEATDRIRKLGKFVDQFSLFHFDREFHQ